MDTIRLGRRIKAFRKLKGYTQIGLAEELEVPIITLGNVERGQQRVSNELLEKIADTLSISKQEIMAEETGNKE